MKISESIAHGILSGGSQAPTDSPDHRNWNRAWDRFFKVCADHLLAYLARQFPNLNHADAQDVLTVALLKAYRSLKEKFDPYQDKIEAWVFREVRSKALDLLAKKGRITKHEAVALDAAVDGGEGLQLHEIIGTEDAGMAAAEEAEVQTMNKATKEDILAELDSQGKCKRQKLDIYAATESGEKPEEVATRFGVTRGYVDSTKNEIKSRLIFIARCIKEGIPLKDAVSQSRAKNHF